MHGPVEDTSNGIARVGIVGAGQLGRMCALAGYPLGIDCLTLDKDGSTPGGQVTDIIEAELDDADALKRLAVECDVVTLDIENVRVDLLEQLEEFAPVYPPPVAVAAAQDRLAEKRMFEALGIPTAPYVPIGEAGDLDAVPSLGWPIVLKTRRLGYDGRGQRIVHSASELPAAWDALDQRPAIAEGWMQFEREVSLVAVRSANDEQVFYPLAENTHKDGILISSVAPFEDAALQHQAEDWAKSLLAHFNYRGVVTIEFFHTAHGLVANEIAPRVHNSGHWTIEGAETSQFENHLRAVLGWPLGSPAPRGYSAMLNLLGREPSRKQLLAVEGAHLHSYGKAPRPGRKLGHVTLVDRSRERLLERLAQLEPIVSASRC